MALSSRPQFRRLHEMIALLRRAQRRGRVLNCRDFCNEFGVTRRTALRDIQFLRDEWRAPIAYDASRRGYWLTDPSWTTTPLRLDRRDIFALGIAQKLVSAFRGTPMEEEMQAVMSRVADSLEGHMSMDPSVLTREVTVLGEDYAPQDPAIWLEAARRIEKHEQVTMRYRKFDGTRKNYTVDPYHLAAYHGDWYMLAMHHRRNKIASFAVSRIAEIKGNGLYFVPPEPEVIRRHLDRGFGITGGDELMKVRLRFSPGVASYIAGRMWHPSQRIIRRKDGSVELHMETNGWKELVRFVLSWLPDVQVLAPEALSIRIREKIEAAQNRAGVTVGHRPPGSA